MTFPAMDPSKGVRNRNEDVSSLRGAQPQTVYFRFPYLSLGGSTSALNTVTEHLTRRHCIVAPVSLDFLDFSWNEAATLYAAPARPDRLESLKTFYMRSAKHNIAQAQHLSQRYFGRQIDQVLLLHCGVATSLFLGDLLDHLRATGWQFISLEDAICDPVYAHYPATPDHSAMNILQIAAHSLGQRIDYSTVNY